MCTIHCRWGCALVVLAAGLWCLGPTAIMAQTTEPPETGVTNPPPAGEVDGDGAGTPSTAHPPGYIGELLKAGDLKQEQVDQMRADGWGWGEIRIATRLAEQMAANSDGTLTFDAALAQVQTALAGGKGFGQIAADNNLKIGKLVRNPKASDESKGSAVQAGTKAGTNEVSGDEEVSPDPANPPAFITKLVQTQVLTQEQVNTMLASGYGWGEVRLAALLAQQIAANSNGALTFDAALAQVQAARAAGKDFGQIAADNNLKLGELVRNPKAGDAAAKPKKPGFLARVGRFFGLSKSADKPAKPANMDKPQASGQPMQVDKPERPERPERPMKAEKPEKPERPSRPERPERGPQKG